LFKNSTTHEFSSSFFYFFFLKNIFIKWRWKEGAKNMKKIQIILLHNLVQQHMLFHILEKVFIYLSYVHQIEIIKPKLGPQIENKNTKIKTKV
jgi:hypothetical protein